MQPEPKFELARIRSRSGKTAAQVAEQSGVGLESYYDLECTDDLNDCISLRDLLAVCGAVGCAPADLFYGEAGEHAGARAISFSDLHRHVNDYLRAEALSLAEFEDAVGWELGEFSRDPEAAWKWNVQCLRDVCTPLKVRWIDALPSVPSASGSGEPSGIGP